MGFFSGRVGAAPDTVAALLLVFPALIDCASTANWPPVVLANRGGHSYFEKHETPEYMSSSTSDLNKETELQPLYPYEGKDFGLKERFPMYVQATVEAAYEPASPALFLRVRATSFSGSLLETDSLISGCVLVTRWLYPRSAVAQPIQPATTQRAGGLRPHSMSALRKRLISSKAGVPGLNCDWFCDLQVAKAKPRVGARLHEFQVVVELVILPGQVTLVYELCKTIFNNNVCSRSYHVRSAVPDSEDLDARTAVLRPSHSDFEPLQSVCSGTRAELLYLTGGLQVRAALGGICVGASICWWWRELFRNTGSLATPCRESERAFLSHLPEQARSVARFRAGRSTSHTRDVDMRADGCPAGLPQLL